MCRHLAYLGPPLPLADCLLRQPHSLLHQSWAPSDMRGGGTVNADGFGIGWLAGDQDSDPRETDGVSGPDHAVARRYRRERPIWSDSSLPDLAGTVISGAIVAAVRSATAGMPVTESACAPFIEGSWMFSLNGRIDGWPQSVAPLASGLPAVALMTLEAPTDSAFLWALVRERLKEGSPPSRAVEGVVAQVLALAPRSRLNLLLNDGRQIAATTVTHSLWVLQAPDSITVSSEPLDPDDRRWQPVPDLCVVEATTTRHEIRPLLDPASA